MKTLEDWGNELAAFLRVGRFATEPHDCQGADGCDTCQRNDSDEYLLWQVGQQNLKADQASLLK